MTDEGNKYLTFYENWFVLAEGRDTDEKRLAFYDTIMRYAFDGKVPGRPERGRSHGRDWAAWDAYNTVKPIIDMCRKRQEAGRRGGRPAACRDAETTTETKAETKGKTNDKPPQEPLVKQKITNALLEKNKNGNMKGNGNTKGKENTNRSVAVHTRACAREDGNGDGNGDGLLIPGGSGSLVALARKFADAVRNDPDNGGGAFFDPAHDPVAMMVALTGDAKSVRRWRQLAAGIADADLRQELFTAYREIVCGEEPKNRAAALNARLGRMLAPAKGAER